ncbi:MAG: SRPBCC domain-containing protein [Bacteroidales bacterium]|nr:SRPBCC domain-containing protein [Bacteroidales bacterium]
MNTHTDNQITVKVSINAPVEKVWKCFTTDEDIMGWNFASDTWHCPRAVNDFRTGGSFSWRMEAKDGSFGFDFEGVYDYINVPAEIRHTLADGRKVRLCFESSGSTTTVTETFEAENQNSQELQKNGWQAILDNFRKYVEANP